MKVKAKNVMVNYNGLSKQEGGRMKVKNMRVMCLMVIALFAGVGYASTIYWNGGTGDWMTPANWDSGTVPGAADTARVMTGNPTLNATTTVANFHIDRTSDTDWGTVTLGSNADLTVTNAFNMGFADNFSNPKLLLQSGSHLTFNNNLFAGTLGTGSAEFRVQGTASLIQTDGAANLQLGIVRTVNLIAEGSGGTIRFASNISNICRISKNVNFRFIFEGNDVTSMDFGSTVQLDSPDLYVDASGITATGTYTLINYADGLTGDGGLGATSITNLDTGLSASVVDSGKSFDLVVIPEPAVSGLLLFSGVALFIRCRRKF